MPGVRARRRHIVRIGDTPLVDDAAERPERAVDALAGRRRKDERHLSADPLQSLALALEFLLGNGIGLGQCNDLALLGEAGAIGVELAAHEAIGLGGIVLRAVHEMQQHAAALDMAEEAVAEADAFRPAFDLARREALWAIRGLRDEPLPLFAAATAREEEIVPEIREPAVSLRPMTAGSEVVEDYGHVGLSLRSHPVSFLREDLHRRRIVSCAEAMDARDGRWLEAAGIVLVRQRPGSAKGVLFVTLEDETGIANLVVWPKVFEAYRRTLLSAGMLGVRGRIQREGAVVHLVAQRISDLSADLASVGARDAAFPLPHGRGDEFHHGSPSPDPRGLPPRSFHGRDLTSAYGHIRQIAVKGRNFR